MDVRTALARLAERKALDQEEARQVFAQVMSGEATPAQIGALLMGFRVKGETAEEIAGAAQTMRDLSVKVEVHVPYLVDTCGTGGDGADTFNISTAVAFTAAACGSHVAKHGNRSASGKVGSADVLEGLGLNLKAPLKTVVDAITGTGVTFLFAPAWHPALVNLAPLRKSLGVRTVFNLLGPLVNPLRPQAQVLGVAKPDLLDPMAGALLRLGVDRSIVVHGAGGLDEASLAGENDLRLIEGGEIVERLLRPEDLGLTSAPLETLRGGDLMVNQTILEAVLRGQGSAAQRDAVAFNTALVLWSSGLETDLGQAAAQAVAALDAGLPWQRLVELRKVLADGDGE